ncbi:methyl-accepting chemotaxis protein [Sanguibacter sp. A247]|uniref:methyl-accepting chemotaxis protein n=1 Tax=unclassified Sanguibacter TaxID=2645534 RepID=UPI003FD6FCAA
MTPLPRSTRARPSWLRPLAALPSRAVELGRKVRPARLGRARAPRAGKRPRGNPFESLLRGSLRAQMAVLVLVAGVCLAVLGVTSIVQVIGLSGATKEVARTSSEIALPAARLRAQVERSSALIGQAAATDDVLVRYTLVDQLGDNDDDVAATVAELKAHLEPAVIDPVIAIVEEAKATRVVLMALFSKGDETFPTRYQKEYAPLVEGIGQELENLDATMDERLAASVASSSASARRAIIIVIIAYLIGSAGTSLVAMGVARRIRRNVADLQGSIEAMADGDLTRAATVTTRDEIGRAAESLNAARASLGKLLAGVRETTDLVIDGAGRVESGTVRADAAASSASSQAGTVEGEAGEVTVSVATAVEGTDQLGVSIREISRSAAEAAQMASEAGGVTGATVATVLELERASEEIGAVVGAITRIAKQTNLLALNASIEAARAGVAGRGFAVVADEVKDLSLTTARQAQDIGERVGAIQAGTTETVRRIEEVRDMVARISDMQMTIASAVEEQTATSSELGGSMDRASASADRIAEAIASVAEAARTSSEVAQSLRPEAEQLAGAARGLRERVDAFVF